MPYGGEYYQFKVLALKPADAIVVIDTDLTVVLEGPAQPIVSQEKQCQQNALTDGSSRSATDIINTRRNNTTETISLSVGVPIKGQLPVHGQQYYQIIWRKRVNMTVQLSIQSGDGGKCTVTNNNYITMILNGL